MKILVLSLLRLGDLIQQKALLRALREKHPQAEIHLLINRQFTAVREVFANDDFHYHYFDRQLLQRSMGESSFNLFAPLSLLENLIQELNAEKFDLVMNWTHNRLSAFLMGTLETTQKQGLNIQGGQLQGLDSPWLRYFNDNFAENSHSYFHYVELLGHAFDLPVQKYKTKHNSSGPIYFQCLTSDEKKNWPRKKFAQLQNRVRESFPGVEIKILSNESEKNTLLETFAAEDIVVCGLKEARERLSEARLLISGDTSLKHLAVECETPVVEITLGGSNAAKTAAFAEENFVVAGKSACYPCRHSQKCSQASHLCAESVSVEDVFEKVQEVLRAQSLTVAASENEMEKAIWTAYLDQAEPQYALCPLTAAELLKKTEILEQYQDSFESCENFNEIFDSLKVIAGGKLDSGFYFQKLSQVFSDRYGSAELAFRALKKALDQSKTLLKIRKQMIHQALAKEEGTHADRT